MIKKFIGTVLIIYILCVTPNLLFAKWINIPQNNTGALQLTPTISTQPTQTNASRFAPVQTKKIKTPQASVSVNFQENAQNQPAQKQGSKSGVKLAPAPAQNEIINVNISIPGFLLNDIKLSDTNYHSISLSGMNSQNEPGKPALPMKRIFIEIPDNASVSFDIASQQQITFDSIYAQPSKYPKKNSGSDSSAQFVIDNTIYSENSFYPQNIIHNQKIIFMRNHRIFVLDIAPFQFNPVEKKLIVNYELSINVNITPNNISECEYNLSSPEYDKSMSAGIYGFNRYAAPAGVLSTTGFAPQSNNLPHLSNSTSSSVTFQSPVNISGLKYMILMDDQFEANSKLAEFIDWKKRKGLNVTVVKTSQINSNGAPYYPEIVNFMRSLAAADYPDYLLIIGDDDPANGVSAASYNDSLRTDLDIACRTDDDFIPDMFYGRLPASNNSELTLMLTKILEIDRTPPVSSMYDRVLVTGDHEEGRPYLETLDAVACYFEQNAGGRNYDCVRAIVNTYNAEENSYWDNYYSILWQNPEEDCEVIGARLYNTLVTEDEARRRIFKEINDGAALLLHDDHGYELGLGHPYFNYSDVKSLNNKKNLPLIMSINCSTGAYYYPNNFTKEWLTHQNGGAYCVIAASDISYLPSCDWMIHGMFMGLLSDYREWHNNSTNPDWTTDLPISSTNISAEGKAVKLSPMLNFGLMYMLENETYYSLNKLHFQIFHIFGDPEAYIMLHNPENLQVKHPAQINRGNQKIIINAEDGCLVSLYSPELNIHQSVYSSNDSAAFNIYAGSTGKIFVTVTKYTKRPYESVIEINDTMPIGCWKFDDTAGDTILDSVYGLNSGRNFGGQKINGLLNKSLHFNGIDDYAVIPETSVNSLQNFTFSCWVNCETSAYNKNAKIFEISNNPAEPNAAKYFYLTSDNQNKWGFGASVSGVNNEMFTAGYSQLKQNEWAHIALTIGNNTVKLFRNGVEEASSAISIYPKDLQPEKFYLARGFKNNDYFGGCLDEMTIFDRALNSDEIKNLAKNIVNIYAMTETVNENSVSSAKFLIKRYGYCQNAVTVNYSVSGTALPGIDFKNLSGSIIIPAGSDSAYINITLIDNQITGINKNIVLSLISNDNYILGNNTISSLTILDDDKINLPIFENFEDTFGSRLNLSSSSQSGKISVIADGSAPEGAAYLLLEKKDALSECLNSLEFDIKLPKNENLELSFWSKKCGDADNTMYDGPYDPYGRLNWNYDVILVSVVGDYWYKILDLTGANISGNWKKINIDLSAAIAAAGYYNPESVKIRFNQFGAQTDTGGIAFDDIKIYQKKNIKITSPANNTDTMQNIIQLNGTTLFTQAGDSMEIYVNNVLQKIIFINQTNQSFSETVALYGVKNIAKTVLRRGFYSTEDSVVINYCGLPAFTILSPSTGSILTKKNISISLASSTALEGDTVKLFVNGSPQNVFTIAGSLIFPAEIIDGLNNITIFLEDRFNRSVSDSITVYNNFYNISAPDTETGLFYLNISGIIGTDNDYIIYLNNCDSFYLTVSNTDNFDTWSFSANPVDTGLYIKLSSNSIKNKYDTSQIVNFEYGVTTDFKIEFIDKNKQLLNAPHFSDSTILSMNYKNRNITSNPELLRFYCLNIADSKYYELSKNNFQYSNNYENKKLSAITNSIGAFYLGAAKDTLIVLNEQLEQQNINAGDTFVFPLYIQGDTFAGGDTLTKIQIKNTGTLQTLAIDKIDFYRDFGTIGRFDSGVDLYISTLNKIGENNFYSEIICPFSENDTGTHFLFLTKTNTYAFQFDTASFEITAGSIHSAEQNAGPAASLNISKTCSIISGLTNALPLIKILSPVSGETRPTNIINVSGTCANAIQNDTIAIYVNGILQSVFRIDGFSDVWSGTAFITNKTDTITAVITNRKGTAIDFITASFSKIVSVSLTSGSGNYPKYYSRNIVDTVCVISFSLQSAVCDTLTQFGISNAENMLPSKIKSVFLWLDSDANDNYSAADSYICELVWNSSKQSWLNNNINFPFKPNDTKFIVTMNFSGSIMNFDEAFLAEIKPYSIKTFYCETGPIETLKNTGSMIISFLTMQNIQLPLGANNGFTYSCIKNIDFDRDGDLDLLVTGYEINTGNKFLLLRNDNGIFVNDEQPALNNNPIQSGCIDVADYDNDGWVDIAVCGKCNNSDKLILFRNNCGKFEKDIEPLGENFRLFSGTVRWGDYDNDGYPDLAVCGRDSNNYNYYLFILKNERGRLRKISNLIDENNGFNSGDIQWIDYDNDGDLDLTICGVNWPYKFIFFKNTGSGFIKDCEPFGVNTGLGWSKIQWADYNNDGLQDFAVSGFDASTYYYRLILFKNTGSGFIKDCEPLGANNGLQSGNLQWADFDNNGLPDLAVSGSKIDINYLFILLNNNGKFEKRIDLFGYNQGLSERASEVGDYDNDGDIDLVITGRSDDNNYKFIIFENQILNRNQRPAAPIVNTISQKNYLFGDTVYFSWSANNLDAETPDTSLSYNLYVRKEKKEIGEPDKFLISADTDSTHFTGLNLGKIRKTNYLLNITKDIEAGTYCWAVQSVDAGYKKSEWSAESSFNIEKNTSLKLFKNADFETRTLNISKDTTLIMSFCLVAVNGDTLNGFSVYNNLSVLNPSNLILKLWRDSDTDLVYSQKDELITELRFSEIEKRWSAANINFLFVKLNYINCFLTIENSDSMTNGDSFQAVIKSNSIKTQLCGNSPETDMIGAGIIWETVINYEIINLMSGGGITYGVIDWADFDNDGDMDAAVCGLDNNSCRRLLIYRNDCGTWTLVSEPMTGLRGLSYSSVKWFDFDNDGYMDFAAAGYDYDGYRRFIIFKNENGFFAKYKEPFGENLGLYNGSIATADIDNDGDMDLIVSGYDSSGKFRLIILFNDNGSFQRKIEPLGIDNGLRYGSIDAIDYDNDGDVDIALTGYDSQNSRLIILKNNNLNFTMIEPLGINCGLQDGNISWADYDNDGRPDFAVSGFDIKTSKNRLLIYKNLDADNFELAFEPLGIDKGLRYGSLIWSDFDNDGRIDLTACGTDDNGKSRLIIFKNEGDNFVNYIEPLGKNQGLNNASIKWVDINADGKLELSALGDRGGKMLGIIKLSPQIINTRPKAPAISNDCATLTAEKIYLKWSGINLDNETPDSNLTYNLYIRKVDSAAGKFIMRAETNSLHTLNAGIGNVGYNRSWFIKTNSLSGGKYFCAVQTVDGSFMKSAWSTEQSFVIPDTIYNFGADTQIIISQKLSDDSPALLLTIANTEPLNIQFTISNPTADIISNLALKIKPEKINFQLAIQKADKNQYKTGIDLIADYDRFANSIIDLTLRDAQGNILSADSSAFERLPSLNFTIDKSYYTAQELGKLRILTFDVIRNKWVAIGEPSISINDTNAVISAVLEHFSVYGLFFAPALTFANNVSNVIVYPNPYIPNDNDIYNGTLTSGILFGNLPADAQIEIYTISGQKIFSQRVNETPYRWNVKNNDNHDIASGVYLYAVKSASGVKTGKLAVIK